MASACVNNIGVPPENFIDCAPAAFPVYGWLSPRISFSREYTDEDSTLFSSTAKPSPTAAGKKPSIAPEASDPSKDVADFEFRLDYPVTMLPADELFSDGKLMPLQLTADRPTSTAPAAAKSLHGSEAESLSGGDPYLFSPKAPRCTSRWRELLGLRKLYQNSNKASLSSNGETSSSTSTTATSSSHTGKSIRQFLLGNSKSMSEPPSDASLNLPLLKDSDCESLSVSSSRLSLSSSSSGHDFDDLHRLSLDSSDTKNNQSHNGVGHPRVRMGKPRTVPASIAENPSAPAATVNRAGRSSIRRAQQDPTHGTNGVSVDSPRMSSSGKIVFQSLERSSSSPSSFNGGPRYRHRGMERSYSANVSVTPVLNVPVCSLRGSSKSGVFGLFSQKKDGNSTTGYSKAHHPRPRHRTSISRARRESS